MRGEPQTESGWRIEVLGTDLGVQAIAQAKRGEFDARAMRNVPQAHRRRWFELTSTAKRGTPACAAKDDRFPLR